ncbi:hypothetical protein I305_03187 [Cryptococcus gattii E566]|uniref:Cupin 2 conserved barrel domain-containing protein n=2 Tax=Cryptococcus gattii TaxID=37769 RepID=E6QZ45_CRYGW|nr:Hypothetical protein CGB_A1140W [Cryptococcus gattii WM276]ADV19382.1 Hypothetical protein CGB_A1140W [Cryptococcus gattii WM276]KIR79953.1 hypothetical protein I306_02915 [Cryptococcus gattii EJB2]KIY34405.1 hypothetical protein I305_03187 [Cryptococcus gattii E566]
MTTLPPPRRIIAAHGINGEPHIIDEEIHYPADSPFQAAVGFLQPELVGKPDKSIEWASIKPARLSNDDAISLRWLDFPPGFKVDLHFTQTIGEYDLIAIRYYGLILSHSDYVIVIHGELEMILHDGSSKTVRAGDTIVQIANIHGWNNNTTEWAMLMVYVSGVAAIVVPSEPVKINGRGLEEPPFNAYHAQF